MERSAYFIRRLLLIVPTLLGITLACFSLTQFIPGGPVEQAIMRMRGLGAGEGAAPAQAGETLAPEYRRQLEVHFGFDQPFHRRYVRWLVRDRLGLRMPSYRFPNRTAWELIRSRLPVSLVFGFTGFLLSYLVCIPLGIAKALRHGSRFDLVTSLWVLMGYATPVIALGMVLKMLLTGGLDGSLDWFPVGGFVSDHFATLSWTGKVRDLARHMFLPLICYVAGNFAVLTLLMKNSLMEQIGRDYVRTVLARGATPRRAIWGHALRNALIPVATGFGGILTILFAGSILIEQIFEIPGMGRLGLESIVGRDYPVFMAILALTSLFGLLGNVLSDLCYVLIDPRIRFNR
ncbi:MAG: ABC transporter permease subunit [Candidatus Marinimicrobia bacterium]|nr:ABC transporter permease subunit [Candidatus Neomarinimicrobiota bacterium]